MQALDVKDTWPTLNVVNGFMLWLTFLVFRIVSLPALFYIFYVDFTEHYSATWELGHWSSKYFFYTNTLIIWVLSCVWFAKITEGLLAALGLRKKKKTTEVLEKEDQGIGKVAVGIAKKEL